MPNTTNFNWTTPADTDYVKDGASAIRTLANGIDSSLVDLKGGTTGQILAKASNSNLDYEWINNDQGDITGVTAGTGLTGGGTSGAVTLAIDSTVATLTGSQTLTNKTLTSPKFETAGEIDDANGNELIKFPATVASAVNEITVANAATGANPSITASGNDTNISLNLVAKGSGTVQAGGVPVVTTTGTQTLTNKTLTSPTITSASGVINNTLTTTTGDIIYASSANTPARLGIGSSGQVLTVSGGVPAWAAAAGGGKLKNSATARSTSSQVNTTSTWASASLSASITPTSSSNKILILLHIDRFWSGSGSQYSVAQARIKRGSTVIYSEIWGLYTETAIARGMSVDAHYVDSPATTSSTTYSVEFIDSGAGVSATFAGGNITLLEIEGL